MSTKHVRTIADLARFGCGLKIECGRCDNCRTLDGFGVATALGTGSLDYISSRRARPRPYPGSPDGDWFTGGWERPVRGAVRGTGRARTGCFPLSCRRRADRTLTAKSIDGVAGPPVTGDRTSFRVSDRRSPLSPAGPSCASAAQGCRAGAREYREANDRSACNQSR